MKARISAEQQAAAGRLASIDEAVATAITDLMAGDDGDLAWAGPYVDEAWAGAARGETVPLYDALADIDAHLDALKR
jgi:predicted RecA/RadA family phage recombinase